MSTDAHLILIAGALLAAGVAAALLASRLRLPALVLFLGVGMAIGSDGLGWIYFDDYGLARFVGTVALLVILFEGGLSTGLRVLRPVLGTAVSLATVGTALTAVIAGLCAHWLIGLSVSEGLLLGAILSPTDGAAVFALMRGVALPRRLQLVLEGEAGFNDPVAVVLVLVMIEVVHRPGYEPLAAVWFLVRELGVGLLVGWVVGRLAPRALRRIAGGAPGVELVATFAVAAIAFGAAGSLEGSGFLAVYVAGLGLGDAPLPERESVVAFHGGLASVAELGMFLTLGLLVFPSRLGGVALRGTVLALLVVFAARPLGAWAATVRGRLSTRERSLVAWAGLRGGVPVVLATLPVLDGVHGSVGFFDLVFFAVLVSTVVQGTTVEWLAGRLGLAAEEGTSARAPSSG
ncbi:MAG TPA: potassium/proton antiporter [Solirubrobacteraceae bacterium]|nr:potassium/proton antiporter [Solirubrobacteraceae bacterium]